MVDFRENPIYKWMRTLALWKAPDGGAPWGRWMAALFHAKSTRNGYS